MDLALGSFEYLEVMTSAGHYTETSTTWHRSLNCGFRVTASAGEDSILDLHPTPVIGAARLYAYLGEKLSWAGWLEAIRKGRTFVTNGPLIQFTLNGEIPGAEIHLPQAGGPVVLRATVESIVPLESFEVIRNGKVVETIPLESGGKTAVFEKRLKVTESGWYTLKAAGKGVQHPVDDSYPVAESSPIYVYVGGRPIRSKADAEYFIQWIDDLTKLWSGYEYWRSDREKNHVLGQFRQAREVFVNRRDEAR